LEYITAKRLILAREMILSVLPLTKLALIVVLRIIQPFFGRIKANFRYPQPAVAQDLTNKLSIFLYAFRVELVRAPLFVIGLIYPVQDSRTHSTIHACA
jgi:hypothetical protein